jgi:hypothetical protein
VSTPVPPTAAANVATDALASIAQIATNAQPPAVAVPPGSFRGWLFGTWLRKNKDKLKTIVVAASGIATAWVSIHALGTVAVLAGGGVSLVTSFLLDGLDYFLTGDPK